MRLRRKTKIRQAGPVAGAVVAAPMGKRAARAGLAQRIRGAIVRRQIAKAAEAVASSPAAGALLVGLAVGVLVGAALMLAALAAAARETQ